MRRFKHYVLEHSVFKTKHSRRLIRDLVQGFEWLEILGFRITKTFSFFNVWSNFQFLKKTQIKHFNFLIDASLFRGIYYRKNKGPKNCSAVLCTMCTMTAAAAAAAALLTAAAAAAAMKAPLIISCFCSEPFWPWLWKPSLKAAFQGHNRPQQRSRPHTLHWNAE